VPYESPVHPQTTTAHGVVATQEGQRRQRGEIEAGGGMGCGETAPVKARHTRQIDPNARPLKQLNNNAYTPVEAPLPHKLPLSPPACSYVEVKIVSSQYPPLPMLHTCQSRASPRSVSPTPVRPGRLAASHRRKRPEAASDSIMSSRHQHRRCKEDNRIQRCQ